MGDSSRHLVPILQAKSQPLRPEVIDLLDNCGSRGTGQSSRCDLRGIDRRIDDLACSRDVAPVQEIITDGRRESAGKLSTEHESEFAHRRDVVRPIVANVRALCEKPTLGRR